MIFIFQIFFKLFKCALIFLFEKLYKYAMIFVLFFEEKKLLQIVIEFSYLIPKFTLSCSLNTNQVKPHTPHLC